MHVARQELPNDSAGATAVTVAAMRRFARQAAHDPQFISCARRIIRDVPPHNEIAELQAIFDFIRRHVRYTKDPTDLELVQSPAKTLEFAAGDCDDLSTLIAAVTMAVGYPTRFIVSGQWQPGGTVYDHVWPEAQTQAGNWYALDVVAHGESGGRYGRLSALPDRTGEKKQIVYLSENGGLGWNPFYVAAVGGSHVVDKYFVDKQERKQYEEKRRNLDEIIDSLDNLDDFDPQEFREDIEGELDFDPDRDFFSEEARQAVGDFLGDNLPETVTDWLGSNDVIQGIVTLLNMGLDIADQVQTLFKGDATIKSRRKYLGLLADVIKDLYLMMGQDVTGRARRLYWRTIINSTKTRRNSLPSWVPGSKIKDNRKTLRRAIKTAMRELREVMEKAINWAAQEARVSSNTPDLWAAWNFAIQATAEIESLGEWAAENYRSKNVDDEFWPELKRLQCYLPELLFKQDLILAIATTADDHKYGVYELDRVMDSAIKKAEQKSNRRTPTGDRDQALFRLLWANRLNTDGRQAAAIRKSMEGIVQHVRALRRDMVDKAQNVEPLQVTSLPPATLTKIFGPIGDGNIAVETGEGIKLLSPVEPGTLVIDAQRGISADVPLKGIPPAMQKPPSQVPAEQKPSGIGSAIVTALGLTVTVITLGQMLKKG